MSLEAQIKDLVTALEANTAALLRSGSKPVNAVKEEVAEEKPVKTAKKEVAEEKPAKTAKKPADDLLGEDEAEAKPVDLKTLREKAMKLLKEDLGAQVKEMLQDDFGAEKLSDAKEKDFPKIDAALDKLIKKHLK